MHDPTRFTTEQIKEIMKEIVGMAKKIRWGGEGFQDMNFGEIRDLVDTTREELTDNLMEMSASKSLPDNEDVEEAVPETNWH